MITWVYSPENVEVKPLMCKCKHWLIQLVYEWWSVISHTFMPSQLLSCSLTHRNVRSNYVNNLFPSFFCRAETVGLLGAGLLRRASRAFRRHMCCEEALLGHPAAAQAVLQTVRAGWPPVRPLRSQPQALQEPGDSDQLHLQSLVSQWWYSMCCCQRLSAPTPFWWNTILFFIILTRTLE